MARRGRRSREELQNVPTHDMTPAEYDRSDTPGRYRAVTARGTILIVTGLHSAKATAGPGGTYEKIGD